MRKTIAFATILAAGLISLRPAAGSAKQIAFAGPSDRVTADPTDFESQARSLFPYPKRYDEAARLFLKAADTRELGDPIRTRDISMAARLSFYRGDVERARTLMERAADEAASTGDVMQAAATYLDAAFLARESGDGENVTRLARKAEMLARSPLLADKDRDDILNRIKSAK